MKILSTGMEWVSVNPGGLSRYYSDFIQEWIHQGEQVVGLVGGSITELDGRPGCIKGVNYAGRSPIEKYFSWKNQVRSELKDTSFDILNTHFAFYAFPWIKLSDIPVVSHFHGPWAYEAKYESANHKYLFSSVKFHTQKLIESRVYRRADQFIVLSESFKNKLHILYGVPLDRIHVIPGGVNINRFKDVEDREAVRRKLGIPEDRFVIVSVRRLVRRMGLDRLIQAVSHLRNEFPHIYLIIVGGGVLYQDLLNMVRELDCEKHVFLTNMVGEEELPLYYQVADLTIMPSVEMEGFGLSTVESLSSGTPVLGTPVGGTMEILRKFDSKLLLPGSDTEDLILGMRNVLSGKIITPSRVFTRQHAINNYSWENIVRDIKCVFDIALRNR